MGAHLAEVITGASMLGRRRSETTSTESRECVGLRVSTICGRRQSNPPGQRCELRQLTH